MGRLLVGAFSVALLATGGRAMAASGDEVYAQNCAVCHNNLKPKLGDKAAWELLMKEGEEALVANVIHGKGAMPPRGGKPALTDDDIKAAVEYIESKVR